eukprot:7090960-Alexandrium_andersonii.AAC.1
MSASLVGSEMCIRDRAEVVLWGWSLLPRWAARPLALQGRRKVGRPLRVRCLLYTSDAADDM